MITDERSEAAVEYLRDTAKEYGTLRGHLAYADGNLRRVKSLQMLETEGSLGEREAKAYASLAYHQALVDLKNATAESVTMSALRDAAEFTFKYWQTQSSNARKGNV